VGVGDNLSLGNRNGVPTPMQWTSDRNAGFSKCDPARLYFPVVMDPIYGYQVVNVEAQQADQSSLLQWTRNMIALRKLFQVFGRGSLSFLNPSNRKILAYLREFEQDYGTHEIVLCVANLSRFAQPVSLDLAAFEGMEPVEMLGYVPFPTITAAPYQLTLAPYSFLWLELQAASSETRTSPEPQLVPVADPNGAEMTVVDLATSRWSGLLSANGLAQIESAMPVWLPRQRWFGAKSRRIQSVRVLQWADLSIAVTGAERSKPVRSIDAEIVTPAIFFVEIIYFDGEPDIYQLPLAISAGQQADAVTVERPDSVLTTLTSTAGIALVHDATTRQDFRNIELALIEQSATIPLTNVLIPVSLQGSLADGLEARQLSPEFKSGLPQADPTVHVVPAQPLPLNVQPGEAAAGSRGNGISAGSASAPDQPRESRAISAAGSPGTILSAHASTTLRAMKLAQPLPSRVGSAEQSNTSILYGDTLILKLFRRLQTGENPDVEIGKFLTEVAHFERIPPFLGEISVTSPTGDKTTVAMLQGLVPNEGDGWAWFLRQLSEFYGSVESNFDTPDVPVPGFESAKTHMDQMPRSAKPSMEAAALLGRRTAEMHLALSCSAIDPAFAPEPCSSNDLQSDAHQIETSIRSAMESLKSKFSTLDESCADGAALLLTKRHELMERSRHLSAISVAGQRIRIHGDFHLGQTLRTSVKDDTTASGGDFVLLDFEGEPARPLSQRRRKQSPLKDVAGMLRSFSYVAFAGLKAFQAAHPAGRRQGEANDLSERAQAWQNSASAEFLRSYRATIAKKPELLPTASETQSLLDAFVLEKAFYELMYELNNRPAWIHIPITGILSLCK
jgi:maltose alpha-D-glucosyltransferase / alpha-amylase